MDHKGWNLRGYLPHCDFAGNLQAITFRLADSLPAPVVAEWRRELECKLLSEDADLRREAESTLFRRIARYEDLGHGSCVLQDAACAGIVQEELMRQHEMAYRLIDWCVMPNHVHVLIKQLEKHSLGTVIQSWKGATAFKINRAIGSEGRLWMPDYHDRLIRDEDHYWNVRTYIRGNPVKAGLCANPGDWQFSSAGVNWRP